MNGYHKNNHEKLILLFNEMSLEMFRHLSDPKLFQLLGKSSPKIQLAGMVTRNLFNALLLAGLLMGCEQSAQNGTLFEMGRSQGTNKNHRLEEASGLAASAANPGYLWTHNDSGNPDELFLINEEAVTKKTFRTDIKNRDWEDIALGPGPEENIQYLYVGDIGDNLARYDVKYIYRIPEPLLDASEIISDFDTLMVKLSDEIRDTETLMIDPISKNLYLVSKRQKKVGLYEITYPFTADTLIAERVVDLDLKNINGGSISTLGDEVLLRNYEHIYYWKKTSNETIVDLLKKPAIELQYDPEPQGESIAWAQDGSGFFTLSENAKGERAKLYFYKRK